MDVDLSELSQAAGALSLRRLRREKLEADVAAAEANAAAAEREAALGELADIAAADPRLRTDRLRFLEETARSAAREYRTALDEAGTAFRQMAGKAAELGVPTVGKTDPAPDALISGMTTGEGTQVGPTVRLRLHGEEYAPPAQRSFERFAGAVVAME